MGDEKRGPSRVRDGPFLRGQTFLPATPRAEEANVVPQPRSLRAFRRGARAMGLRAPASHTGRPGRKPVGPATTDEARSRSRTREADSGDTLCGVRASRADTRPDPGAGVP